MGQTLDLSVSGLYTSPNEFSAVPPGALLVADNTVIDKPNIAQSRRGQKKYAELSSAPNKGFDYKDFFLVNYGTSLAIDSDHAGTFTNYTGLFEPPTADVRIRSSQQNENIYLTTLRGILKLDTPFGTWRSAGSIKALGATYVLANPGFMSDQIQIAYRMVWGYKDANNNEIIGAPSQRMVVVNDTGDTANVTQTWQIPSGITTSWFYRVYRSGESAGLEFIPDDELQQVKEGIPTTAEISAGFFTFTDTVVNGMRGATLYTSPSQQGILQANEPPPFSLDIAAFRNCNFYFNTTSKQRLTFTLLNVGDNSDGGNFGYQTSLGNTTSGSATITSLVDTAAVVIQDLTYTAVTTGAPGNDVSVTYIDGATAGAEIVEVIDTTNILITIEDGVSTAAQIKATIDSTPNPALVVIQDLTYTAATQGAAGNEISIEYFPGATAGAEVVVVSGNAIRIKIQSGVSTATQVRTAFNLVAAATALVTCTVSGTGGTAQVDIAETFLAGGDDNALALVSVAVSGISSAPQFIQDLTFLEDGFDTTTLHVGMRVVGTGIPAGSTIATLATSSSITISANASATASNVSLVFQDIFRIGSLSYYAGSANDFPNHVFKVTLDGTPQEQVEATALDLIQAINQDTGNANTYAYYESSAGTPGIILLEERGIGGNAFWITSTKGTSFSPELSNSGTANISLNDAAQNRVYISKPQEPEAVPILQYLPIGSKNFPIVRAVANKDGIFVFKEGEGVYRISGTSIADFTVSLFNSSAQIRVPESAQVLDNNVYCFSDQGIIKVSENGVEVVSIPIEETLLQISSPQFTNFDAQTFAVSYESDRKYIFFTVTDPLDEFATQAFVFNTLTNSWTRWIMTRSMGIVLKIDNKLYMGDPENDFIFQERKNYDRYDYSDQQFAVTIVSSSGLDITLTDTSEIEAGFTIKQGGPESIVTEVVDATTITVSDDYDWVAGAATVYQPIAKAIQWVPVTDSGQGKNPGILKHFSECTVIFSDASFRSIDVGFQTNFDDGFDFVTVTELMGQGWGKFPWGERPWGVAGGRPEPLRTYVSLEKQRASWINFRIENEEAFSSFSLAGISCLMEPMSSRFR